MRYVDFFAFARAREAVRLNRLAGGPKPWTDDPILRAWKFTNVKREHDRTTMELRHLFYDDAKLEGRPRSEILINCATYRYFGTSSFARALGWQRSFDAEKVVWRARHEMSLGRKIFTGAYVCTNAGHPGPKAEVISRVFLAPLWAQRHAVVKAAQGGSWRALVERLRLCEGFGGTGFMAKEVALDLDLAGFWKNGEPHDRNTWTPVGPGARRGAARMLAERATTPLREAQALEICRELFAKVENVAFWPKNYPRLELTDTQWILCEWDKYERVRLHQGFPRSKYDGG